MNLKLAILLQCFTESYQSNPNRNVGTDIHSYDKLGSNKSATPPIFNAENIKDGTGNVSVVKANGGGGNIDPPLWHTILAILACCAIGSLINYCISNGKFSNKFEECIGKDKFKYLIKVIIPFFLSMIILYEKKCKSQPRTSMLLITIFLQILSILKQLQTAFGRKLQSGLIYVKTGIKICYDIYINAQKNQQGGAVEQVDEPGVQKTMDDNLAFLFLGEHSAPKAPSPELLDSDVLFSTLISFYFSFTRSIFLPVSLMLYFILIRNTIREMFTKALN